MRFEIYLVASEKDEKPDNVKVNLLLSCAASEAIEEFCHDANFVVISMCSQSQVYVLPLRRNVYPVAKESILGKCAQTNGTGNLTSMQLSRN